MHATIDQRHGTKIRDLFINECANFDALKLIRMLDGRTHMLVSFERQDGWHLFVGGGPLACVVTSSLLSNENYTLPNSSSSIDETTELCLGGQYGVFPNSITVGMEAVARAISRFFEGRNIVTVES